MGESKATSSSGELRTKGGGGLKTRGELSGQQPVAERLDTGDLPGRLRAPSRCCSSRLENGTAQ